VRKLGAQNINGSQKETDGLRAEVSHALRTGRRYVSGLYCDWRWNMGFFLPHLWIQASSTTMMRCKKKSWRGLKGWRQTSMTRGYRSWSQGLINVWTMSAIMLQNKVMYGKFIHSVAFVNEKCFTRLRPLYIYFPDTPRTTLIRRTSGGNLGLLHQAVHLSTLEDIGRTITSTRGPCFNIFCGSQVLPRSWSETSVGTSIPR